MAIFCTIYYILSYIQTVPQVIKLLKTKSSNDYSLGMIFIQLVALICWSLYIFTSKQSIVVYIGTIIDLVLLLFVDFLIIKYFKFKKINEVKQMNKIYIVHCWDGTKDDGWYPWIDKELSNDNNTVYRFNMPNTNAPKIDEWVSFLDKQVSSIDDKTYFIGHSIGCQTILRYLQTKGITKIGGILFVAPWFDLLDYAIEDEESFDIAKPWLTEKIDFEKIKEFTANINCIFSDDDYFVSLEQKDKFEKLLNANTVVVSGKGHICQEDGVFELKEILDECNKMIK